MFSVINRYIFREALAAWLLVTAVLLFILLSNQFAEVLGDAAANRLPRDAVFQVMGLSSLQYLTILAPVGLFLGLLLALARLNSDSEMVALNACGVGPSRLLVPLLLLAVLLAGGIAWLSLQQAPAAVQAIEDLELRARQELQLALLEAGRFTTPDGGETVIYAQSVDSLGRIEDVFIQRRDGDQVAVILAERGERRGSEATGFQTFVLFDGKRYEGVPGEKGFRIVEFAEHGIPLRLSGEQDREVPLEAIPTRILIGSPLPEQRAELQWRWSAPLSLFVLTLLAVPLSRSRPREGRFGRLAIGILVYILYSNMLAIARVWVERDEVPDWLGLWWVHGLVVAIAVGMLYRQLGGKARKAEQAAATS